MSSKNPTYKFRGKDIEIGFTMGSAITFKHQFDINLLNLFEDGNLDKFATTVALNDEKMLDIWWHFVSEKGGYTDREECIDVLTRDSLTEFKEAFWAGVVNFSDPAGKPILLQLKKQLPGLLKQQAESVIAQVQDQPQQNENS